MLNELTSIPNYKYSLGSLFKRSIIGLIFFVNYPLSLSTQEYGLLMIDFEKPEQPRFKRQNPYPRNVQLN